MSSCSFLTPPQDQALSCCTSGADSTIMGFTSSYVSSVKTKSASIGTVSEIFMKMSGEAINRDPANSPHDEANSFM